MNTDPRVLLEDPTWPYPPPELNPSSNRILAITPLVASDYHWQTNYVYLHFSQTCTVGWTAMQFLYPSWVRARIVTISYPYAPTNGNIFMLEFEENTIFNPTTWDNRGVYYLNQRTMTHTYAASCTHPATGRFMYDVPSATDRRMHVPIVQQLARERRDSYYTPIPHYVPMMCNHLEPAVCLRTDILWRTIMDAMVYNLAAVEYGETSIKDVTWARVADTCFTNEFKAKFARKRGLPKCPCHGDISRKRSRLARMEKARIKKKEWMELVAVKKEENLLMRGMVTPPMDVVDYRGEPESMHGNTAPPEYITQSQYVDRLRDALTVPNTPPPDYITERQCVDRLQRDHLPQLVFAPASAPGGP